ncbi:MAG: LysE family transporter, partial [Candidatus Aminicenantes bacterium]|nr:LysE family transporter [Candidatus Aminicenantes bacterium]
MFFIVGILIGFVAAIPLGPVNAFVISQSMKRDFFHGFVAGVTAAVLDFLYCLIALLGIALITVNITRYQIPLKIVAGVIMLIIGWRLFLTSKKPVVPKEEKNSASFTPRPIFGVILLYVSNPSLYFFWIWAAGWAAGHGWILDFAAAPYFFALSCGLGGFIWYTVLSHYVANQHHQFKPRTFQRIFLVLAIVL